MIKTEDGVEVKVGQVVRDKQGRLWLITKLDSKWNSYDGKTAFGIGVLSVKKDGTLSRNSNGKTKCINPRGIEVVSDLSPARAQYMALVG